MVRDEWIRRCAARYVAAGDVEPVMARLYAQTRADDQAELHGESGAAWISPEDAADEDMADWDEDG
ncbi:hypothetical protein [Alicycliphilus denitrificans]|uniref:hypothetical protein n=1 Tax=Alicycliphilus denitrificans TaxID=179636 RepID=UPI0011D1E5D7|nr:hypothetical protein [Alicycliphilus denitrificans]